jgi:epoxyqueuosine reductase
MSAHILKIAQSLGASLAGVTDIALLRNAPSYQAYGDVMFPPRAKSVLVLALAHRENEPELDWWGVKGGTIGNQRLQQMTEKLKQWLNKEYNISVQPLPYQVGDGGIFLKDAAVLAELGVIGANNLLVTPEFGPRVRLRALFLDIEVTSTEKREFSPCNACDVPCRQACPQNVFFSGSYNKNLCEKQMKMDEANRVIMESSSQKLWIKYCRACELVCPIGK